MKLEVALTDDQKAALSAIATWGRLKRLPVVPHEEYRRMMRQMTSGLPGWDDQRFDCASMQLVELGLLSEDSRGYRPGPVAR